MTRALVFLASGSCFLALAQNPCDKLKALALPDSTITAVEAVAAGPAQNAGRGGGGAPPAGAPGGRGAAGATGGATQAAGGRGGAPQAAAPVMLPAYCRVAVRMKPSSDSSI